MFRRAELEGPPGLLKAAGGEYAYFSAIRGPFGLKRDGGGGWSWCLGVTKNAVQCIF